MRWLSRRFIFSTVFRIGVFSDVAFVMIYKNTRLVAEQASGEPPFHCVTLDALNRILYVGSMSVEDIGHVYFEIIDGRCYRWFQHITECLVVARRFWSRLKGFEDILSRVRYSKMTWTSLQNRSRLQ